MPELSHQEIFDNEGHINYDKVVEIVHLNFKNFLNAVLEESFNLAADDSCRAQINEASIKVRDSALDAFLERKHIVTSEFYVELESRFYTSSSVIMRSQNIDQVDTHSMDTDLIELALAINQLIERSVDRHAELIEKLTLQLEELSFIAHQEFNVYCLHPQDFYKLIQNCIAPLNLSVDGKILISKLLYQNISPSLNDFYMAMHKFLLDVDINPSEASNKKNDNPEATNIDIDIDDNGSNSSIMSMSTGQFYAPVEQEMWQQEYEAQNDYVGEQLNKTPEIIDEVAMDVYGPGQTGLDETTVSLLLQPYSPNTQSDSSPAQRRQFVRALSSVQRVEASSNAIFQASQIKTAVRRTLHEKGALDATEIVDNEEKVIDFVSNIFHVILKDDSICDAIKTLLARLQISTIKLALIDFTFFQNEKHPARQLLNKLTSIGISASEKQEPLFNKLNTIIRNITDNFETDVQVFEQALLEIQQLDTEPLEQQTTREETTEKNKHKLWSQRSAAKRVVIHTIKKFIKNKEIPNQILEFCLKCWAPHMAYIYMNHGRTTKEWRNSVRMLRRIIEVSQSKHSLHDVRQYIHHPDSFFENIRTDLEYFENRNDEFEDVLEEAEVWYLTYLRKIEKVAEEIQNDVPDHDLQTNEQINEQDNVIHLFKNLSPTLDSDTNYAEAEPTNDAIEIDENNSTEADQTLIEEEISEQPTSNTVLGATEEPLEIAEEAHEVEEIEEQDGLVDELDSETDFDEIYAEEEHEERDVEEIEEQQNSISELDSETEFDENDIEEEPEIELNVAEHLPDSIVPGVWLEIFQGEEKAKRRLKFTKAITETNNLVFSDRSGDYSLEIDLQTFLDDLSTGRSSLISESNRFDLALSSVISNIRSSQDSAD